MAKKKSKLRTSLRKNHQGRTRQNDLTQGYDADHADDLADDAVIKRERVSGKGQLTRKRTIAGGEVVTDESGEVVLPDIDHDRWRPGRVLRVQGLVSIVQAESGELYSCATRRLLKQLATELRHVVAAGDQVWFRPEGEHEGIIERVEPRYGVLSRNSRGRQHLIVTNVDQVLIVASAAEPRIKPGLIDRFLVTAEKTGVRPVICINKADLIDLAGLMPLVGVYSQLGYQVILVSAATGFNVARLRHVLQGRTTAVAGQSGVGKSSLLNQIQPGLGLRVQEVSGETQKGKHTTTTAELFPLDGSGWVIDTPGIRQFQLWDVIPEEVASYFRELRPYVSKCRFPDCTHTHEDFCSVKDAVADGWIDSRRYESYTHIQAGDEP